MTRFVLFILCLTLALIEVRSYFHNYFSQSDRLRGEVGKLKERLARETLRRDLMAHQLDDFRQVVATLLPEALKPQRSNRADDYPLRNLATIVFEQKSLNLGLERAGVLFSKAKTHFQQGEYERSNRIFSSLIQNYPDTVHLAESYFLLAEGQFQAGDFEGSVRNLDAMITLFPESSLTGYGMLRLGKIFESQDRFEDAEVVYRTISKMFKDESMLVQEAQSRLKAVEL